MKLSELLLSIKKLATEKDLSIPFIVGGLPRDKLLNRFNDFNDVDITTGDNTIHELARQVAINFKQYIGSYTVMSDGHAKIIMGGLKLDFSSNFEIPGISYILKQNDIKVSKMSKELYSRDFTCNTALMTMTLDRIIDPTGTAVEDISNKIIKTCLDPKLTLGFDNNRIVRALYLSAKLDFDVDENIISWISANPDAVRNIKPDYMVKKIRKGLKYNRAKVIDFINKTNMKNLIPPMEEFLPVG